MSISRQFELLYALLEKGHITASELASRFEVTVRTIYRDIDALSAAGIPIYATPGRNGGIFLLEDYVLDRAVFSREEQRQLLTALRSLPPITGRDAADTLSKLSALFRIDEPDWLQVDLSGWGGETPDFRFGLLRQAILQKRPVRFSYAGSDGASRPRRVLPARLVFKGHAWYLQAFCLDREAWRTFKVGRMLGISVQEKPFTEKLEPPPVGFDEDLPCPFAVSLVLRFPPWMAYRVYDEFDPSAVTEEEGGALLARVTFPEDQWLYGYLLSFGAGVQVVEPEGVRQRLGRLAKIILENCENPDSRCQDSCATMGTWSTKQEKQEVPMMHDQFCQSCGMPLSPEVLGTEADGAKSPHYCNYCYQNGAFTGEMTMEEMIDFCVPHMVQANPGMTPEQAKAQMQQFFPMLMRWRKG